MKKISLLLLWLLLGVYLPTSQGQILYSEDFDNIGAIMPSNMTIIDGDVATANTNVAGFDLWSLSQDRLDANNAVATVTSWLDPAGQSDDWMITPLVSGLTNTATLSWEAASWDLTFADGYEVWVTTTIAGTAPVITDFTTNGAMVFSIAAEDTLLTPHTVSLAAYANQSVYVAFRNNSNDRLLLSVDDIVIENTAAPSLTATFTTVDASCGNANGSITLTTTGGTAPYSYQWDAAANNQTTATATNLAAGNYDVTVTDATGTAITGNIAVANVNTITLYSEDFENTGNAIPSNMTVIDADAAGPNTNVAALDQWIVAESNWLTGSTDTVAIVTSWLDPAGQSDDWLITPQITGLDATATLSWEAAAVDTAFADGYEVWVTSTIAGTTPSNTDFTTNGAIVFSIAAENPGNLTARSVSLAAYANQSIYIAFRNNSNDQYVLAIDDIEVTNACPAGNVAATATSTPATCGLSNGTATVTATGGASPYTILWDAAANNQTTATATSLMAGSYMVTVTDANGTTASTTVVVASSNIVNIYTEDFEGLTAGTMRANITVLDIDAASANSALNPAFDQWIAVPFTRLSGATTNVAAVTSWIDPAGQSDDWMITPQIMGIDASATLSWEAVALDSAFPDGYEVWVTSTIAGTTPSNTDFINSGAIVFSIPAENPGALIARSVSLAAYANQNIYIAFRNNSNDKYLLGIDNISVDQNCPATGTLAVTASSDSATCGLDNATATVNVSGGQLPYTYQWDANAGNQTTATAINLMGNMTYFVTVTDGNGLTGVASVMTGSVTPVSSSITIVNTINCFGDNNGAVQAMATNGRAPYTYAWDANTGNQTTATASNLSANLNYTVTITDSDGCTDTASITLSEPSALIVTATDNGNNTATALAIGGTSPYTYAWSNGQTGATTTALMAGTTYAVTATDSLGCTAIDSVTTANSSITATVTVTDATCGLANGTATVTATGGSGVYTYLWDLNANNQTTATATNLAAGSYTVTVTDNAGATFITSATVGGTTAVDAFITTFTNVNCAGEASGTATVAAAGGTPNYTFQWSANANSQTAATAINLSAGTYYVTATDGAGCTDVDSITITEPTPLVSNVVGNGNGTATASATGGVPPYLYQWDANAGSQTTATATGLMNNTTYSVTITDNNGCTVTDTVNTTFINITNINSEEQVSVYPNPASSTLWVKFDLAASTTVNVRLMSVVGQEVISRELDNVSNNTLALPIEQLPTGVYALEVTANERKQTFKVVIE